MLSSAIVPMYRTATKGPVTASSIFSGIQFIKAHKNILGAISLDLFVVLLGGATALLPAYARDILRTGPWGLGLLRLSPAVGALSTSIFLAHHPIRKHAGHRMFIAVIIFGVAIISFALSRNIFLSMGILCVLGAADVTSVVVRSSLVQLETPDEMRGRVSAVNSLFIGTSNQLGEFESGITASWFGIVPATIIGGIGSIVVALIWMGTACILNSRRCGRTHCRYTGPYYLGMIGPVLMLASGVVSAGFSGWLILGVLILAGGKIIWWATEFAWGKFS